MKSIIVKMVLVIGILVFIPTVIAGFGYVRNNETSVIINTIKENFKSGEDKGGDIEERPHQLSIEHLRNGEYPGSEIVIEQILAPGINYQR